MVVMNENELTVSQAAVYCKCSTQYIDQAIAAKLLKFRWVGPIRVLSKPEVDAWNAARKPKGRPPKAKLEPVFTVPFAGVVGAGPGKLDEFPPGATIRVPAPQDEGVVAYLVSGDSMADDGVKDGDTVLVRVQPGADHNEMVIAWVDGDAGGMVFKKYRVDSFGVRYLMSGKWKHVITEHDHVYGVHVATIRKASSA